MKKELARESGGRSLERTRSVREVLPPVDIYENDQELLLVADIPGVESDALNLHVDPPELRIEGRRARTDGDEPPVYVRAFQIGDSIDPNGISAELHNGVLNVHLKKVSAVQPRKIAVRAG